MVGADYVEDLFGAALGLDAVLEGRESVAPRLLPLVADGAGGEAAEDLADCDGAKAPIGLGERDEGAGAQRRRDLRSHLTGEEELDGVEQIVEGLLVVQGEVGVVLENPAGPGPGCGAWGALDGGFQGLLGEFEAGIRALVRDGGGGVGEEAQVLGRNGAGGGMELFEAVEGDIVQRALGVVGGGAGEPATELAHLHQAGGGVGFAFLSADPSLPLRIASRLFAGQGEFKQSLELAGDEHAAQVSGGGLVRLRRPLRREDQARQGEVEPPGGAVALLHAGPQEARCLAEVADLGGVEAALDAGPGWGDDNLEGLRGCPGPVGVRGRHGVALAVEQVGGLVGGGRGRGAGLGGGLGAGGRLGMHPGVVRLQAALCEAVSRDVFGAERHGAEVTFWAGRRRRRRRLRPRAPPPRARAWLGAR